jgi:hypothetical protein
VEKRLLRCTNAHYRERRVSARRGVSDVLAQKNEFVVRGERQNQERRASARRGSQTAPATATVYRGVIAFLAHDRHQASDGEQGKHSGGGDYISRACPILEPRLAYTSRSSSDVLMRLHRNAYVPPVRLLATGGLRPPLLCWCADVCRWNNAYRSARPAVSRPDAPIMPRWDGEAASRRWSTCCIAVGARRTGSQA